MNNLYNQKHYALLYKNMAGRHLHTKIDLLNNNDVKVDSFENIMVAGNINLSNENSYRRTGNLSTKLESNLLPKPDSKIWFNKRIQPYVGLSDWKDDIYWYDMGKFAVDKVSAKNSLSQEILDINMLDYIAFLDGTLSGYLSHETNLTVKSGVKINEAIRASVEHLSKILIEDFKIEGLDAKIPYDMTFNPNGTVLDIVKQLTQLYMSQEFFFDTRGIFRVQRIKDRRFDPIVWDFTEDNMDLSIDYVNEMNMANIKNSVWVWGNFNEDNGLQIYWVYRNRWVRNYYSDLNNLSDKQKGDICHITSENNSYMWNGSDWELLDFKVIPIFNVENIGEKIWTYSDSKIFTEQQARLRSEYELQQTSNFAETITFSCAPIYLLGVNNKIKIKDSKTGIEGDYLTKQISHDYSINGVINMQASKIYY